MGKPVCKKKLMAQSVILLLFSLIVLTTAVYGWLAIKKHTEVSPFLVKLVSVKSDINYEIEGITDYDSALVLENSSPGKEYRFTLTVTNLSQENANLFMYFSGFSEPVLQNGIYVDMRDIFMVRFKDPDTGGILSEEYFRDLIDGMGRVPVINCPLAPSEVKTVQFYLVFSDTYLYKNEYGEYVEGNIDLFQGQNMKISKLVIELG